ncbi:MAG: hypothetical protein D6725_10155 [Planctomycetota bacterium]|nr:MAG: hypothetical protein D6725_10155 [Planctomycetota bacterium]
MTGVPRRASGAAGTVRSGAGKPAGRFGGGGSDRRWAGCGVAARLRRCRLRSAVLGVCCLALTVRPAGQTGRSVAADGGYGRAASAVRSDPGRVDGGGNTTARTPTAGRTPANVLENTPDRSPGAADETAGRDPAAAVRWVLETTAAAEPVPVRSISIGERTVRMRTADGERAIAVPEVVCVQAVRSDAKRSTDSLVLLADGQRVAATVERVADETLVARRSGSEVPLRIPLETVRAVIVHMPLGRARADTLVRQVEVLRTSDDQAWLSSGLPVRGELSEWTDAGITFATELGDVRVKQEIVRAVVLNSELTVFPTVPAGLHWLVLLHDGSALRLRDLRTAESERKWQGTAAWGQAITFAREDVLRARPIGGRVVYLTAEHCERVVREPYWRPLFEERADGAAAGTVLAWLTPRSVRKGALLLASPVRGEGHGAAASPPVWPVWHDRNARGWPLRSDRDRYALGWGVLGAADIVLTLPNRSRRFLARCGLDRTCGVGASVRFAVVDDNDELLWQSRTVREPGATVRVDVELPPDTRRVTLRTYRADRGDAGDFANWYAPCAVVSDGE